MEHWVLYCFLLSAGIQNVNGVLPKIPLCDSVLYVAWRRQEPYLLADGLNVTGVIPSIFEAALRTCCRGDQLLNYSVEFKTQQDVVDIISNYTVDFIMPMQKDLRSNKYLSYPFVSIVESPGVAFYVVPGPSAGQVILEAIKSTWPLIAIMFVMVSVAGTFFWILEMNGNEEQQKRSLLAGVTEGMWWAFVSMTTVGYGDVCPKTKAGKAFGMCWVMTGVACCALFTAYVTTILTSACLSPDTNLLGTKVGLLKGDEVHSMAMKKNAIPLGLDSVPQIIEALQRGRVDGALIDTYIAAEYQNELDIFRLQEIIEHVTTNGVVFLNRGVKYWSCIREYLLSRQDVIFKLIQSIVNPLKARSQSPAQEKSRNLLNPTSPNFYMPVVVILAVLTIIMIIGSLWDKSKEKKKGQETQRLLGNNELTLSQWRKAYLTELHEVVKGIHTDTEGLKTKCQAICDRLEHSSCGLVSRMQIQ